MYQTKKIKSKKAKIIASTISANRPYQLIKIETKHRKKFNVHINFINFLIQKYKDFKNKSYE